jgi:hypothetical protein
MLIGYQLMQRIDIKEFVYKAKLLSYNILKVIDCLFATLLSFG